MPSRLVPLIEKIEAGDPITHADVARVTMLQELDAARQPSEVFEEMLADEKEADRVIEKLARAAIPA